MTDPIPGVDEYAAALEQSWGWMDDGSNRPVQESKPSRDMSDWGAQYAARVKEMFHAHTSKAERSQQATLGPSEIGHPCDRRIAMSLLRHPPCNPGGDNFASWLGTQGHSGLADMFLRHDAGSGRFAVEVPLTFGSEHVPHGTSDLFDRAEKVAVDHKFIGSWSLNKLKAEGPSPTYRVQLQVYGLGYEEAGEEVKRVALIAWPRDKSSLANLYVWDEPYDRQIALDAIARVDRIAGEAKVLEPENFPIDNSDCKFCSHYKPGAKRNGKGVCNGRD